MEHPERLAGVPVLLLHGDADPVVPVEQSQRLAAGGSTTSSCTSIPARATGFANPSTSSTSTPGSARSSSARRRPRIASRPVTDDWNPNDPDVIRVHYDLSRW